MSHLLATWSIAMLLGGMTLFSAVFAPLVFLRLPTQTAGRFIRAVFPWYYLYLLACSGLATLWLALTPGREALAWTLLIVFITALYARQWLMPAINRLRDAAEAGDAAAGAAFQRRHAHSVWINGAQWLVALGACGLMASGSGSSVAARSASALSASLDCDTGSGWVDGEGRTTHLGALIEAHRNKRVWLLGEQHDQPAHHAWQLEVLTALYSHEPGLVIAMEMFPREAQPALDAWVAGNIGWETLLTTSHWEEVWGFPAELYRPLLEFARVHRVPVIAMNVHPSVTHAVARGGLAALPAELRSELGTPATPSARYREEMQGSFRLHQSMGLGHAGTDAAAGQSEGPGDGPNDGAAVVKPQESPDEAPDGAVAAPETAGTGADEELSLERFLEAQLTWDRAMATAIGKALASEAPPAHVVALLGGGHTGGERGVPWQLADLGVRDSISLLASEPGSACGGAEANPLMADARFVLPGESLAASSGMALPPPPRLGVALGMDVQGARILSIEPGSLAEREGLLAGDVIVELAGQRCESPAQVVESVQRQPSGTWLPITLQREGEQRALVIRFPPAP